MKEKPNGLFGDIDLICISGSSGVGKTTIARSIAAAIGMDRCIVISGDDFHKWERGDPAWKRYTHLDPRANNLDLAWKTVIDLATMDQHGPAVKHRRYCHQSGKFGEVEHLRNDTGKVVIYEGLHALLRPSPSGDPESRFFGIRKCMVFVEADKDLKDEWKIARDMRSRGYTREQVLKAIEARRPDEQKHIEPQSDSANLVVRFSKSHNSVYMTQRVVDGWNKTEADKKRVDGVATAISEMHSALRNFVSVSRRVGANPDLVQGRGGNISVKAFGRFENFDGDIDWVGPSDHGRMIVKESGKAVDDVGVSDSHIAVKCLSGWRPKAKTEAEYDAEGRALVCCGGSNPTMEYGLHLALPHRVVVHTHPIHLNAILCSNEWRKIIDDSMMYGSVTTAGGANISVPPFPLPRFWNHLWGYIHFVPPGFRLADKVRKWVSRNMRKGTKADPALLFLQNHGLVVAGDGNTDLSEEIDSWAAAVLATMRTAQTLSTRPDIYTVGCRPVGGSIPPLFPDAAVFPSQMSAINEQILRLMVGAGLTPNFITPDRCGEIASMESEKRRKAMS